MLNEMLDTEEQMSHDFIYMRCQELAHGQGQK